MTDIMTVTSLFTIAFLFYTLKLVKKIITAIQYKSLQQYNTLIFSEKVVSTSFFEILL